MKLTKQRLREVIKEEVTEAYSRDEFHKIVNARRPGAEAPSLKVTEILQNIMQIENDLSSFRKKLENQIRTSARRNIDQHPEPGAGASSFQSSEKELEEAQATLKEVKKSLGTLLATIKI